LVRVDEDDEAANVVGTGVYLVTARLDRQIPNVVSIQGKKIKVYYPFVKKAMRKRLWLLQKNDAAKRYEVVCFENYTKTSWNATKMCCANNESDG
jgi:hypothetical protein